MENKQLMFRHTESEAPATLAEMLKANAEDEELCEFLRGADVGAAWTMNGACGPLEVRRVA